MTVTCVCLSLIRHKLWFRATWATVIAMSRKGTRYLPSHHGAQGQGAP